MAYLVRRLPTFKSAGMKPVFREEGADGEARCPGEVMLHGKRGSLKTSREEEMRKTQLALPVLLLFLFLVACAPQAAPVPQASAPVVAPAPAAPAAMPAKAAWQVEWEKTLAAAKKEGIARILTGSGYAVRAELTKAFKSRFDMNLEFVSGNENELSSKVLAERRAGIYSYDVTVIGSSAPFLILKPAGALDSLGKVLLLPELTDPQEIRRVWRSGELDWVDQDHTLLAFAAYVKVPFVVNTNLVKPGEIKAYRDLLNPKLKGKIVMGDPTIGTGVAASAMQVLPDIVGWDYLRKLAEQQPVLNRDRRQPIEWVALGKYPVALLFVEPVLKEFLDAGAPLASAFAEEGNYLVGGNSVITLLKDAPHPNAAKLYINWLLSKEGQTVYCSAFGAPSGRIDVSTEGFNPEIIPGPGKKYLRTNTEKALLNQAEMMKMVREIFGPKK